MNKIYIVSYGHTDTAYLSMPSLVAFIERHQCTHTIKVLLLSDYGKNINYDLNYSITYILNNFDKVVHDPARKFILSCEVRHTNLANFNDIDIDIDSKFILLKWGEHCDDKTITHDEMNSIISGRTVDHQ
jgi:hypothetical protein